MRCFFLQAATSVIIDLVYLIQSIINEKFLIIEWNVSKNEGVLGRLNFFKFSIDLRDMYWFLLRIDKDKEHIT